MDPFNNRGLCIYIACLVDLNLKNELFYLGTHYIAFDRLYYNIY